MRLYSLSRELFVWGNDLSIDLTWLRENLGQRVRIVAPGLAVTAAATLAAAHVSVRYGASLTLMALLIGFALNFLNADKRLEPGLSFASRTLLRLGIVLLGARVTFEQIGNLGLPSLVAVAIVVALTMIAGVLVSQRIGLGSSFGIVVGGATAICGASAALAFATLLGEKRVNQAQLGLVLVGISAASAAAMILYPVLARYFGFDERSAGFLFGASIHDVAQALGAGFSFSPGAGETTSIVKLTRVALLAPALAVVAVFLRDDANAALRRFECPWFVVGFFVLAAVASFVGIPRPVTLVFEGAAAWLLAAAVAATGIMSPIRALWQSGARPLLLILATTITAFVLSFSAALLLFS